MQMYCVVLPKFIDYYDLDYNIRSVPLRFRSCEYRDNETYLFLIDYNRWININHVQFINLNLN